MKKIACIDVGLKRIGVAFCFGDLITPQNAILRKNRKQASKDVHDMLIQWDIDTLVVGIPLSGSSHEEMQRRIRHFVDLIGFEGNVCFVDEYGSSMEAKEKMQGITRQKKDGKVDSLSACIILERYVYQKS